MPCGCRGTRSIPSTCPPARLRPGRSHDPPLFRPLASAPRERSGCDVYGTQVRRIWDASGTHMGRKCDASETYVGHKCDVGGTHVGRRRDAHATYMGLRRDFCGTYMRLPGQNASQPATSATSLDFLCPALRLSRPPTGLILLRGRGYGVGMEPKSGRIGCARNPRRRTFSLPFRNDRVHSRFNGDAAGWRTSGPPAQHSARRFGETRSP